MTTIPLLGLCSGLAGCLCLYLAADNQRWLAAPWPKTPARAAGALLLMLAWLALAHGLQRLTASFALVTEVMLVLSVLPYLGALLTLRRARRVVP